MEGHERGIYYPLKYSSEVGEKPLPTDWNRRTLTTKLKIRLYITEKQSIALRVIKDSKPTRDMVNGAKFVAQARK